MLVTDFRSHLLFAHLVPFTCVVGAKGGGVFLLDGLYVRHSGRGAHPSYLRNNVDKEVENGLALQHNSHNTYSLQKNVAPPIATFWTNEANEENPKPKP